MQKVSFCFLFVIRLRDASGMPSGFLRLHNLFFFLVSQQMQPGKPLPGIRSLMAVINSVGVGRGSKSVGEFTYRYTRGRTIASRRITKNTSKTPAQVGRRGAFGSFVWMFSPYKWFFSDGYEKTKHGSSFNQFVHVNRELLGKSPYNSEVNKKLIPNGTQLWNLFRTIFNSSVSHLKYATYGTLNFVNTSVDNNNQYAYNTVSGTLYTEDFKGITVTINSVFSDGRTFVKEINLYNNGENPDFLKTYDFLSSGTNTIKISTNKEQGTVEFLLNSSAVAAFLLDLSALPPSSIAGGSTIIIKQYGKIASLEKPQVYSLNAATSGESEEESSGTVQEDNTEIK